MVLERWLVQMLFEQALSNYSFLIVSPIYLLGSTDKY